MKLARVKISAIRGPNKPPVIAGALVLLGISHGVLAEPAPVPSQTVALNVDSGFVSATQGTGPVVVFSHLVQIQGAPWIRLHFGDVQLSGSPSVGNGSFLRITSQADECVQVLDSSELIDCGNSSAYFNGDSVVLELFAWAETGANRLVLEDAVAGIQGELDDPLTICGPDDRVPSADPRAARIMPSGCTGFLFNQRPNCLLTAGHCVALGLGVVEFNVPLSPNGAIRHPCPQDQYCVDQASIQFLDLRVPGDDWCQFGAFNNDTTGFSPLKEQGASYKLAESVPAANGNPLRLTGYGVDNIDWWYNRTQQTDAGPYQEKVGTIVKYVIDTKGGNSGSAVEHIASGLVYAFHAFAGCNTTGGAHLGTAIDHPGLQSAIACPMGVCGDCNGNGILDQCDLNCVSPCGGCNVSGCGDSSDCNSNGVPDECDIASGTTQDCIENGIPDDCELPSNPIRACCLEEGYVCELRTQACCELDGGVFHEFDTWCGLCALLAAPPGDPEE